MTTQELARIQTRIDENQEILDTIYQTINIIKLPYKYFKKFNILPLDIVEGEIEKYFDINILLLENYNETKHISWDLDYFFRYSSIPQLTQNFSKYFNNIPEGFIDPHQILNNTINNHYNEYKELKIISPEVDMNLRSKVELYVGQSIKKVITNLEKSVERYSLVAEEIRQQEIDRHNNTKYFLPITSWLSGMKLTFPEQEDFYLDGIKIVKVCNKVVKYIDNFNKPRQIKITQLQERLEHFVLNRQGYRLITEDRTCYYTYTLSNLSIGYEEIN